MYNKIVVKYHLPHSDAEHPHIGGVGEGFGAQGLGGTPGERHLLLLLRHGQV